jgi:hypothetical protein
MVQREVAALAAEACHACRCKNVVVGWCHVPGPLAERNAQLGNQTASGENGWPLSATSSERRPPRSIELALTRVAVHWLPANGVHPRTARVAWLSAVSAVIDRLPSPSVAGYMPGDIGVRSRPPITSCAHHASAVNVLSVYRFLAHAWLRFRCCFYYWHLFYSCKPPPRNPTPVMHDLVSSHSRLLTQ